jgi:hypothetical protein
MYCELEALEGVSMAKRLAGRPPKFSEPSRPVTVTLPERILEKLQLIDKDRGSAITKTVDSLIPEGNLQLPPLEIIKICDGQGLIVIEYSKALSRIPGIQLIEIAPVRYIISVQSGASVDSLELALIDLIDHMPASEASEIPLLVELRKTLKSLRRNQSITKAEILFVPID